MTDEKKEKNFEEVEETLDELRDEKKHGGEKTGFKRFLSAIAKPFRVFGSWTKKLLRKIRIPITVKTTLIYTLLYSIATSLLGVFIVLSVENRFEELGIADDGYMLVLKITVPLVIVLSVIVVAALGSLASRAMLSPIRKIIKKIDKISADDLSERVDDVDSSDELRELTDRINAMLDNLEQSFDRQKKFVSDASHELKTPIAVIQGYSGLLKRWGKSDPEVLDESIDSIAREAENMKRIVEQLLLLARIGRYMLTPEEIDVGGEIKSAIDGYELVCKTHNFSLEADSGVIAIADKNLFTECVRAVADNAIKYSDENTTISFTVHADGGYAVVKIIDSGRGISPADLPHVFDRFYRCDKSRGRDKNSSGLGLTIAKSAVEMMNGTIEAESELGKGSTFTLRFPLKEKKS